MSSQGRKPLVRAGLGDEPPKGATVNARGREPPEPGEYSFAGGGQRKTVLVVACRAMHADIPPTGARSKAIRLRGLTPAETDCRPLRGLGLANPLPRG